MNVIDLWLAFLAGFVSVLIGVFCANLTWRNERRRLLAQKRLLMREIDVLLEENLTNALNEIQAREAKNKAYTERNQVVSLLARLYPSGTKKTVIDGEGDVNCVYIDTPAGQMSWRYHDAHVPMFAGLPAYEGEWDGHTTEEKHERLQQLVQMLDTQRNETAAPKPEVVYVAA